MASVQGGGKVGEDCSECKFLLLYTLFKYTLFTLIVIALGSKAFDIVTSIMGNK